MSRLTGNFLARAKVDSELRLVAAQEPLAGLQQRCGGELPGALAIPELREALASAQQTEHQVARSFSAFDGENRISAWVEIVPDSRDPGGWILGVANWQARPVAPEDDTAVLVRKREIERSVAELAARLDAHQCVLAVDATATDLVQVKAAMEDGVGRPWTDFVQLTDGGFRQPLHWRLLDGSTCQLAGSDRSWSVCLIPVPGPDGMPSGFELYLVADRPQGSVPQERPYDPGKAEQSVGRDLAPILRQPIARIVANAETIRARLAGPLTDEYRGYAADIAAAGNHLLSLLDDLADLEVVESDTFSTAPDAIDLGDVARRAAGILAVRAQEKSIRLVAPPEGEKVPATAEFRRVLQILLNLLGNAIRYSPESSEVRLEASVHRDCATIAVVDDGPGLTEAQQAVVFEKFERLGRSGDGGSGLGLYISSRIARAMGGALDVKSAPGKGARFTLSVPKGQG